MYFAKAAATLARLSDHPLAEQTQVQQMPGIALECARIAMEA
jgi:hypothetical protein